MNYEENANRWHTWRVSGDESQISALLDDLDASLPEGWRCIREDELKVRPRMSRPGSHWYSETTNDRAGAILTIERPQPSELRGGPVSFTSPAPSPKRIDLPPAWDSVNRFFVDGVLRLAAQFGAKVYDPSPAELFLAELPFVTKVKLLEFSDKARKQLPLDRKEAESWDAFVVAAFRERAVVADTSFVNWLVASGWSGESAEDLVRRFFENSRLLSHYRAELVIV